MRCAVVLGFTVALLAGCAGGTSGADRMANISLEGSPNESTVGPVDPDSASITIPLGGRVIIGGFRGRGCGAPAPDFQAFMEEQVDDGLRVPDGIVLYDAGIGQYNSGRCKGRVAARAIGARAEAAGSYRLRFFGGEVTKTVTVE